LTAVEEEEDIVSNGVKEKKVRVEIEMRDWFL
jgi:hypothetical protein